MADQPKHIDDRPIIVLVGPSGTGKSTLANIISAGSGIHRVRSYTDRPSRKDETIEDYHFVNSDRMNSLIAQNSLFAIREHKQADGSTFRYGFKKSDFEVQADGFHASDSKQFKQYSRWDLAQPGSLFAPNKIIGGSTPRILGE